MSDNFISVPLRIEDELRKLIKNTQLVLNIRQQEDVRLIKGVIPEGLFSCEMSIKDWKAVKAVKDEDSFDWISLMDHLLPTYSSETGDTAEPVKQEKGSFTSSNTYADTRLQAKFTMSRDSYEDGELIEDFSLVTDHIVVSVQTDEELSKTYGSFHLKEVDEELDIFQWMRNLLTIKEELEATVKRQRVELEDVRLVNEELEYANKEVEAHERSIVSDLVSNFSAILNSKKKRIVELQNNKGKLNGLNKIVEDKNKNRLDNMVIDQELLDKLPEVDTSKVKRKRTSRSVSQPRKRQANSKKLSQHEQEETEAEDDVPDEEVSSNPENEHNDSQITAADDSQPAPSTLTDKEIMGAIDTSPEVKEEPREEDGNTDFSDSSEHHSDGEIGDSLTDFSDSDRD